jgi:hypothetical protein
MNTKIQQHIQIAQATNLRCVYAPVENPGSRTKSRLYFTKLLNLLANQPGGSFFDFCVVIHQEIGVNLFAQHFFSPCWS